MRKRKRDRNIPEPAGLSESGIDLSAESLCIVFSAIILVQSTVKASITAKDMVAL